jgi:outer membrane protein OmpA-like peptidoglycan-associated protein/tetratricopeptide (TPR) repeat protein
MSRIYLFSLILSFAFVSHSSGQSLATLIESPMAKGDRYYSDFAYVKALDAYKDAFDNASEVEAQTKATLKIAETYRKLNDPAQTVEWFDKIGETLESDSAIYLLHYAQALSAIKKYSEAKTWFQRYKVKAKDAELAEEQINAIQNQEKFYRKVASTTVDKLGLNQAGTDFAPAFYGKDLLFVSARKKDKLIKADYQWDESDYLDLFIFNGETNSVDRFFKHINTKYHEGPLVIYNKETKMILTRNGYFDKKVFKSEEGVTHLQLFYSELENGKWSKPAPINLNNSEYSIGHPAISEDGKKLYFVSDMPGGFGGTDLYVSEFEAEVWGTPRNLGPNINTSGNEMFPFLTDKAQLFFASNGHGGLGGLDIFGIDISNDFKGKISNLGAPINTEADDFSLIVDKTDRSGYFSSNREGSKNNDDIYSFSSTEDLLSAYVLKGLISDKLDNALLDSVQVSLLDENDNTLTSVVTGKAGAYQFDVEPNKLYNIRVEKNKYLSDQLIVNTPENDEGVWRKDVKLLKAYAFGLRGVISDKENNEPIDSVSVVVTDNFTDKEVIDELTGVTGLFEYSIPDKKLNDRISYLIKIEKVGYLAKKVTYNGELTAPGYVNINEKLDLSLDKIEVGADIGKLLEIQPIYFDLGKSIIRSDAAKELDKIVLVMQENPQMKIELGSHTDARGSDPFNLKLSDKRAKASAAYIVSQGIDEERISGKGYGETQLINSCTNGAKCSEEQHQLNRRTEFTVIEF